MQLNYKVFELKKAVLPSNRELPASVCQHYHYALIPLTEALLLQSESYLKRSPDRC